MAAADFSRDLPSCVAITTSRPASGLGGRVQAPVQLVDIVFLRRKRIQEWCWHELEMVKDTHRQMAQRLAEDSNRVDAPSWTPPDPSP